MTSYLIESPSPLRTQGCSPTFVVAATKETLKSPRLESRIEAEQLNVSSIHNIESLSVEEIKSKMDSFQPLEPKQTNDEEIEEMRPSGTDGRTVRVVSGRGYRYVLPFPYKLQ